MNQYRAPKEVDFNPANIYTCKSIVSLVIINRFFGNRSEIRKVVYGGTHGMKFYSFDTFGSEEIPIENSVLSYLETSKYLGYGKVKVMVTYV